MDVILAVDTNIAFHEKQSLEWAKYGIASQRIDTMHEAIALLAKGAEYYFIAINEDSVPDFMSMLRIMRDATENPIFVLTSAYTDEKKIRAMSAGADVYDRTSESAKINALAAIEHIRTQQRWASRAPRQPQVLAGGDVILSVPRRMLFVKNTEVSLTKKEFEILRYLMMNNGQIVTHAKLLKRIWGEDYAEKETDILWRTVDRIRAKLADISPKGKYIHVKRGVGYKFHS